MGQPLLSWAEGGGCPSGGVTHLQGLERDKGHPPSPPGGVQTPKAGGQQIFQYRKQGSRWEPAAVTSLPALYPGSPPCRGQSRAYRVRGALAGRELC